MRGELDMSWYDAELLFWPEIDRATSDSVPSPMAHPTFPCESVIHRNSCVWLPKQINSPRRALTWNWIRIELDPSILPMPSTLSMPLIYAKPIHAYLFVGCRTQPQFWGPHRSARICKPEAGSVEWRLHKNHAAHKPNSILPWSGRSRQVKNQLSASHVWAWGA